MAAADVYVRVCWPPLPLFGCPSTDTLVNGTAAGACFTALDASSSRNRTYAQMAEPNTVINTPNIAFTVVSLPKMINANTVCTHALAVPTTHMDTHEMK